MEGGCRECVNTNTDTDSTGLSPRTFRGCSHTTRQIIESSPQEKACRSQLYSGEGLEGVGSMGAKSNEIALSPNYT